MRNKRSKFWTFTFSLLPGAGHMYMGFMKTGISLMSAFFFVIFLSAWLDIAPLLFILPMLWFYSFFDCINRRYASDEEFDALDDNYLFSIEKLFSINKNIFHKRRLLGGLLLLLLGLYIMWNNLLSILHEYIPYHYYSAISHLTRIAPQLVLGMAVIIIGARLVIGKKKEYDYDD